MGALSPACDVESLVTLYLEASSDHFFFFQAEDGIRDTSVTGVQTCALPISHCAGHPHYFARQTRPATPVIARTLLHRDALQLLRQLTHFLVVFPHVIDATQHEIGRASCRERV